MLRIMSYGIDKLKELIGNGMLDLSLEEKKVGTDISGKPIYSRTFTGITANMLKLTDTGDIENLILTFGYMTTNHGGWKQHAVPTPGGSNYNLPSILTDNNIALCISSQYANVPFQLTCLYTKITD